MGTVPVEHSWSTGEVVTAAELNSNVRDAINFLLATPRCLLTNSGSIPTYPDSVEYNFPFDTAIINTDSMWTAGHGSRMYANTPGLFEFDLYVHYPYTSNAITFFCGLNLNGSGVWGAGGGRMVEDTRPGSSASGFGTSVSCHIDQIMNVGDYVEAFRAQSNYGGNVPGGSFGVLFSGRWVASS